MNKIKNKLFVKNALVFWTGLFILNAPCSSVGDTWTRSTTDGERNRGGSITEDRNADQERGGSPADWGAGNGRPGSQVKSAQTTIKETLFAMPAGVVGVLFWISLFFIPIVVMLIVVKIFRKRPTP